MNTPPRCAHDPQAWPFRAKKLTFVVWRVLSWPRLAGITALGLLAVAARAIPALALGACVAGVVVAVAVTDRLPWIPHPAEPAP